MRLPFLLTLTGVASFVRADLYERTTYKIKESIHGPPPGWARHKPAPSDHLLELKVALPQPHFPILEKHLWEVSNPEHERYGAYLSKEETDALMAPHPESLNAVSEWLSSHGIREEHLYRSSAQDLVTIRVPISLAEEMLSTRYDIYMHLDSGESIIRTTNYSLPEHVYGHVELIQPTTMFNRLKPLRSTLHWSTVASSSSSSPATGTLTGPAGNQVDAGCNITVTVNCLRQIYNAVGYNTSATNGNMIAVAEYLEQYANNQDLQQFFEEQNAAAYGSNYTLVLINNGLNNQSYEAASAEANLDTQLAYGLTYPTPAVLYSTGGSPPFNPDLIETTNDNEPYLEWLDFVCSQENPPQTISTSYGDDEQTVPNSYATLVCNRFAALGVRGVSLLFSSGDGGVGGGVVDSTTNSPGLCLANDGSNKTVFMTQFPASCPFVTSVGGTYHIPEKAISFSGGGFSNYFSRPDYQDAAVTQYLNALGPDTYKGLYNPNGRAVPDVAALADNFRIIYQGRPARIGGTSCSAPVFASIISMLNDARMSAGMPPLGFLNPWLYQNGLAGLNDITVGHNIGCGTQGFNATVGWDAVTGLGTPNFEKLLLLAMAK